MFFGKLKFQKNPQFGTLFAPNGLKNYLLAAVTNFADISTKREAAGGGVVTLNTLVIIFRGILKALVSVALKGRGNSCRVRTWSVPVLI